jgi:hypothetical protein
MYFQNFPQTFYTLDNAESLQIIQNILLRGVFNQEIKNNFAVFDEYDVRDLETPEIVAYKFYGSSNLHWVILHANEILDPRFKWPLSQSVLSDYVEAKYENPQGVHHYENNAGKIINGNVQITTTVSANNFSGFNVGDVIVNENNDGNGKAFITSITSANTGIVTVTEGGFSAGDRFKLSSNANVFADITATTSITGTIVTNYIFEELENEKKRRIRVIKPEFVDFVVKEFQEKIGEIEIE